jgi:hypothetical protein
MVERLHLLLEIPISRQYLQKCKLYDEAAAAGGGGGGGGGMGGGGAAPVIDTTGIEDILREAYDRLSAQFGNLGDEVNRGSGAVIAVLREIEQTLGRIPAAEGGEGVEEDTGQREHKEGEETGGDVFGTPTAGSPQGQQAGPRTPADSIRASLMAGTPIEPAYTADRALELAHTQITSVIRHHGGAENPQTAETMRKTLLRQTLHLRRIATPYITGRDATRLSKIPESKPDDLSAANLNVMIRLIRFFRGTGMPASSGIISSPAMVNIAEPTIELLATLLLERGKIEEPGAPVPAPAGPRRPSSAA